MDRPDAALREIMQESREMALEELMDTFVPAAPLKNLAMKRPPVTGDPQTGQSH
jgi:hypothetical protein